MPSRDFHTRRGRRGAARTIQEALEDQECTVKSFHQKPHMCFHLSALGAHRRGNARIRWSCDMTQRRPHRIRLYQREDTHDMTRCTCNDPCDWSLGIHVKWHECIHMITALDHVYTWHDMRSYTWYVEGSFLSVDRLSLQCGKVSSGKLERIFPSINFSSEFSRIHAKVTQKSFDPTKAKCCKLVQQQGKTWPSTFQALSFL